MKYAYGDNWKENYTIDKKGNVSKILDNGETE
jgi:hypothetical protein